MAGARIELWRPERRSWVPVTGALADEEGRYRVEGVPPGTYKLKVEVGTFGTNESWIRNVGDVEVEGRGPAVRDIILGPFELRMRAVDRHGRPVGGVEPWVWREGHVVSQGPWYQPTTDADGWTTIPFLEAGQHDVRGRLQGVFTSSTHVLVGESTPEIEVRLPPYGSIVVRVQGATGYRVPGLTVVCEPLESRRPSRFGRTTDSRGEVRFLCQPGQYVVYIDEAGYRKAHRIVQLEADQVVEVVLELVPE